MAPSWCKDSPILNKVRGCILLVVIVVTLATAIGFTLWFIGSYVDSKSGPQTQPLVIRLDAFSLSNFEVSNSSLSAEWDAKVTFGNQNSGLTVTLYPFESFVYYKEDDEDALSCASVDAMHIPPRKQKRVQIKFDSTGCGGDQPFIEDHVLKELSEDRKSGYLTFSLKMHIDASYSMRELLGMGTQVSLDPNCTDLKVEFVLPKVRGRYLGEGSVLFHCLINP